MRLFRNRISHSTTIFSYGVYDNRVHVAAYIPDYRDLAADVMVDIPVHGSSEEQHALAVALAQ
jgi:hypothetical protein